MAPPTNPLIITSYLSSNGFHPVLDLHVSNHSSLPANALLDFTLTLGPSAFVDRFEIERTTWHSAVRMTCTGDADLEVPAHDSAAMENALRARIDLAEALPGTDDFALRIPFHMRYQPPSAGAEHVDADAGLPSAQLWYDDQKATDVKVRMACGPIGAVSSSLSCKRVDGSVTRYTVRIPVGQMGDAERATVMTYGVIVFGVILVLLALFTSPNINKQRRKTKEA
ncbi:unnamed protein product [Sphagnum tenellum]